MLKGLDDQMTTASHPVSPRATDRPISSSAERALSAMQPDAESKVKGYGLLVYGGMMALGGGILAERHLLFLLLAAFGFGLFLSGAHILFQRGKGAKLN